MAASSSSFPSSFAISSACQWTYDVFLSFRGEDTRNTLVDFLYYALHWRGLNIFKDDEKLEGGKGIKPELLKAIEESRFAVVILSEYYASSTWCLDELVKIVDCRKEKGMTVLPIFYNVDPSDVRKQTGTFAKAFDEHEKQLKERVGTYRDALKHVADIAGHHQDKNRPLSEAVKWIVGQLSHISSFEFSKITEGLVGIDSPLVELESCFALKDDVCFVGIWAMGGMGKTTLAWVVYCRDSKEFEASCFIENVREKDELSLQKDLISQILPKTDLIKNKYDGAELIKKILWNRKVLLVFDDVDETQKLKMLVRKGDRYGSGSRIILTTRDEHVLKEFPLGEDERFEVKPLNYEDARCLFFSKAFKKEHCPVEYLELSRRFLEYVNGLPLALEVLGSFLFEKSTNEWEDALEMFKEEPAAKINNVLKISFHELSDSVKDIFKDIACFYNDEEEDNVVRMLESLGRRSKIGLSILVDKSLLKISNNNELWMHNLIEDMGRNMVRHESLLEPGERSRLWLYKDIDHVLKNNTGTGNVQAIDIKGGKETRIYHEEKEACWRPQWLAPLVTLQGWVLSTLSWQGFRSLKKPEGLLWDPNAFLMMRNLKFLRIRSICLQHDTLRLPNSIRYLEFNDYPLKSLNSLPAELVELRLMRSKIKLLWVGVKIFENLKSINMDGSSDLLISPNFNGVQNLEKLVLSGCSSLRELHPSVGKLKKLELLDLSECQQLASLPDKFEMESLVSLYLTNCFKVKKIPEFVGNMELLQDLFLCGTAIIELPSSVECLTGLNFLTLDHCKNLLCLPNTICRLTSLNFLDLFGCSKFDKLPENLGNIASLKQLCLCGTAIRELPSSVEFLIGLEELSLSDCEEFVVLPSTICSLKSLIYIFLSGCPKFDKLPKDLGNIVSLKQLRLSGTAIKELPSSVEFLIGLEELDLSDCKEFVLLPSTVCSLKSLHSLGFARCSKFVNLPVNLGDLKHLSSLCLEGTAIAVLPSSVGHLGALRDLNLKDCKNLLCLPSTICNLKRVHDLNIAGCSKITNLPENLGNMESLHMFFLGGTAIKELPSSTIRLKKLSTVSFRGCQLSSSSLTSMPRSYRIDLSDCNLSAIPSGIDFISNQTLGGFFVLTLRGNDFVSLPESITQFSGLTSLYLDGCKSLRSLSNIQIPSNVKFLCVDNCTSLERLPEPPNDFYWTSDNFTVQCFNCFKLAYDIRNFCNVSQGQCRRQLPERPKDLYCSSDNFSVHCLSCFKLVVDTEYFCDVSQEQFEKCYIIPGREIPNWFVEVNICDTSVAPRELYVGGTRTYKIEKVKLQLPRSGFGCDEWRGIVLCVVFLPTERHHRYQDEHHIRVNGQMSGLHSQQLYPQIKFTPEYGKVDSHHLWLRSLSKCMFDLRETPCRSIDKKGFHQFELEIETLGLEVEKIGFCVV